jgi:hypothetical protein
MKFLSIATALTLLSVTVSAQSATNTSTTTTTSTETYPAEGAVPTPKAEWMDLIKSANITNAPVLKSNGADGKIQKKAFLMRGYRS